MRRYAQILWLALLIATPCQATVGLYDEDLFDKTNLFAVLPTSIPDYLPEPHPWKLGINLTVFSLPGVFDDTSVKRTLSAFPFLPKLALMIAQADKIKRTFVTLGYIETPAIKGIKVRFFDLGGGIDYLLTNGWSASARGDFVKMMGLRTTTEGVDDQLLVTGLTMRGTVGIQTKRFVTSAYTGVGATYAGMSYRTYVNNLDMTRSKTSAFEVLGAAHCAKNSFVDCYSIEALFGTIISPVFLISLTI